MQEIRTITVLSDCLEAIKSEEFDRLELLQEELEDNNDIKSLIGSYHDSGQVTYNVNDLRVDVNGQGFIDVNYIAHKYSGCRDVDLDEDGDMTIDIDMDVETGRTTLTGENWPEREPDEY